MQKAMVKEPNGRYATAQELAADLRRFLANQPIRGTPTHGAGADDKVVVLPPGGYGGGIRNPDRGGRGPLDQRRNDRVKANESRREALLQQIQRILSSPHSYGWSDVIADRVREAARLGPDDDHRLQGYAAASLGGLDARLVEQIPIETAAIRFDPSGQKLYLFDTKKVNLGSGEGSANPIRKLGTTGVWPLRVQARWRGRSIAFGHH